MSHVLLGLALAVGAPNLKEKPAPVPALVGEWVPECVTVSARPSTPGSNRWEFRADGTFAIYGQGKELEAGPFTREAKGAEGTLDLTKAAGGRPANLCRYRVEADTLVLSVGHDPGVRPPDLQPANKTTVWVFKRVKPRD